MVLFTHFQRDNPCTHKASAAKARVVCFPDRAEQTLDSTLPCTERKVHLGAFHDHVYAHPFDTLSSLREAARVVQSGFIRL